MKRVAVVILNWNGKKWLEKFLPSVVNNSNKELADIIVADNASTDDSLAFLNENYPEIKQIVLDSNFGFTGGYNRSIAQLENEYIVLLNSDIEVSPNWIEPIIRLMDGDQKIAACQPKILSYNSPENFEYAGAAGGMIDFLGYPFCRGRIFDTFEKDNGQYDDARRVFWATGACLFVRTEVYKNMGGLDEFFFAHMEEIDLCWRMQNAGYHVWVEPQSKVYHVGGGTLQADNPRKTFLNFRNNLLMILKNRPLSHAYLIIFARLILDGAAGIQFLFKGQYSHCLAILKAHFAFYRLQFNYWGNREPKRKLKTIHSRSILIQYFLQGKKRYKDLF
ncbi:MAG: GT2 family glycosyltransferase [Chitinophagales bacterium]|jgi:GT2 family glycosyltransferase